MKKMKYFIYLVEWVVTFLVIWIVFKGVMYLFRKNFKQLTHNFISAFT